MNDKKTPRVQLPHVNNNEPEITPRERLVYLYIKRYMNTTTKECFPSLTTLKKDSGLSIPTLRKCIATLAKYSYIKIRKEGKKQIYIFNDYKKVEPISLELLADKNMTFTEKSLMVCAIENMKDKGNTGLIEYSNKELSEIINMPESTISKCLRGLSAKEYLVVLKTEFIDHTTGLKKEFKYFDLEKIGEAVFYVMKNHEDRIQENTASIAELKKELEEEKKARKSGEKLTKLLMKELQELKAQKSTLILN